MYLIKKLTWNDGKAKTPFSFDYIYHELKDKVILERSYPGYGYSMISVPKANQDPDQDPIEIVKAYAQQDFEDRVHRFIHECIMFI